jgi:hypothetical protein
MLRVCGHLNDAAAEPGPFKNLVHDFRGQKDFTIGNGRGCSFANAVVKSFNQLFHPKVLIEAAAAETEKVGQADFEMLPRVPEWRKEICQIALARFGFVTQYAAAANVHGD